MKAVRILGIVGSAKKDGNTAKLVKKALEGAQTVPGVKTELYELAGKKIKHCVACFKCLEKGACALQDDLGDLVKKYMSADGVIWGTPVYHLSVPGIMKSALDRLGNVIIANFVLAGKSFPRLSKVCGVLTDGGSRYGGQELVLNFLIDSCLAMNGIVVSGDTALGGSMIGAAGCAGLDPTTRDSVLKDEEAVVCTENLGKRVAESTKIYNAGMLALREELPPEYFYTWKS